MRDLRDIYDEVYDQDFQPKNEDSYGWIQWKGTDVCMDIHCKCGHFGHFDGDYFYHFECPECHRKFAVGSNVKFIELNNEQIKITDKEVYEPWKTCDLDEGVEDFFKDETGFADEDNEN